MSEPHVTIGQFFGLAPYPDRPEPCRCYDIPTKKTCGKPATRYQRVGPEVVEHVCEDCYQRDIQYPGVQPATEAEYEEWLESDD
jgi:hypothetical protein